MSTIYTTTIHAARIKLKLSMNDYAVADSVYHLSNNPKAPVLGWCSASKKDIGDALDLSEQSIHSILNKLMKSGLVEKNPETKFIRTTLLWYENAVKSNTQESLATLKKLEPDTKESLAQDTKESLANIHIYDKDINILPTKETSSLMENSLPITATSLQAISKTKNLKTFEQKQETRRQIDEVHEYFLKVQQIPKEDCTIKDSRRHWYLLLNESKTGVAGVKWLIDLVPLDPFFKDNITSSKDLYYKRVKLIARKRGAQPKTFIQT
jgi:DNA-binding MarR family transcriptional regulator